jgi:pilus assembly protein CpaF
MLRVRYLGSDGQVQERVFEASPVRIGRDPNANEIVLDSPAVSRQHARVFFNDEEVSLIDASVNGTLINGAPIDSYVMLRSGDDVILGDCRVQIDLVSAEARVGGPSIAERRADDPVLQTKRTMHDTLLNHLDLKRLDIEALGEEEVFRQSKQALEAIIRAGKISIPDHVDREVLVKEILDEALGLGPLEDFLKDDDITEVMVVCKDLIYIEKLGKITLTDKTFTSDDAIRAVIERIVTPLGRRIDESSPLVDARLKDGSRVNAIIPPLAIRGPCITIRKFRRDPLTMKDLVGFNTMTPQIARFLQRAVRGRCNMLVSGGTGSGKTTLLNVLSTFIPSKERIVTIEDSAELRLDQEHVVCLEARPANIEGRGEFTIRDLVKNSLRMRPDRIIVGECRGGEALDMLQAMNTGHDGSLTTGHSNSTSDMLARLETMVLMSGMELPLSAVRHQIASAIDVIVHQERLSDGSRKVTEIAEVTRLDEHGDFVVEPIFRFLRHGLAEDGTVLGEIKTTGYIPTFIPDLVARGIITDGEFL